MLYLMIHRPAQPQMRFCHRQQQPVITDALLERGCAERTMKIQTPLLSPRSAATSARTSERILPANGGSVPRAGAPRASEGEETRPESSWRAAFDDLALRNMDAERAHPALGACRASIRMFEHDASLPLQPDKRAACKGSRTLGEDKMGVSLRPMLGLGVQRVCERARLCRARGTDEAMVRCGRGLCAYAGSTANPGTRSIKITPADATRAVL